MNKLVVIGTSGSGVAFLNVSKEEAVRKLASKVGVSPEAVMKAIEQNRVPCYEFSFDDSFYTYESGPLDETGYPIHPSQFK